MDWSLYPSFSKEEFDCKHTGLNDMRPEFMDLLQEIRNRYARPIIITSGYRHPSHPVEAKKSKPGAHSYGVAADIRIRGVECMELFFICHALGIRRVGLKQNSMTRFMHIDIADRILGYPQSIWTYH